MHRREDRNADPAIVKARSAERTSTIFFVTVTLTALVITSFILSLS